MSVFIATPKPIIKGYCDICGEPVYGYEVYTYSDGGFIRHKECTSK
jgi:hypothetical protein